MNESMEFENLTALWQSGGPQLPGGLARTVERQSRWMRVHTAAGVAVSVVFFAGSLYVAIRQPSTEFVVMAIGVWILTLTTLLYSLANRTGTWRAEGNTTQDYVDLLLRRARAGLQATRYGLWLVLVEVLLLAAWHTWYWSGRTGRPSITDWLIAALLPLAFLVALLHLRARRRQELSRLDELARELSQ